ncbi:hypothetical protein BJ322DRAFT_1017058 [Thelephora terrestris]|uniref:Uncharacterized protein n=1 Tax=Thelephora terrestris TaxID=56493 RepID=A0A9P6HM76_9AGAM|nr:hypothetical protein BJ322DRAFT_1017058 [Thelephora terrestris]
MVPPPSEIENLFDYGTDNVVEIKFHSILCNPVQNHNMNNPTTWTLEMARLCRVRAGYLDALLGFDREIKFVSKDKIEDHECFARCNSVRELLNDFLDKPEKLSASEENPSLFQSQVLGPTMQLRSQ